MSDLRDKLAKAIVSSKEFANCPNSELGMRHAVAASACFKLLRDDGPELLAMVDAQTPMSSHERASYQRCLTDLTLRLRILSDAFAQVNDMPVPPAPGPLPGPKLTADEIAAPVRKPPTVEEVAKIVDPKAFRPHVFSGDPDWHPDDHKLAQDRSKETAQAILALWEKR
jgi:hypothetical protein